MAIPDVSIHAEQMPRFGTCQGLRVREDVLYTNHKGAEKKALRRNADKTLAKLASPLSQFLTPGEAVLYILPGQAPLSAMQQFTFGWWGYLVTRCIVIITNQRILQFLVDSQGKWRRSVRVLRWGDATAARVAGWLNRTFELLGRDGKKDKFWKIERKHGRKLRLLAHTLLPASAGEMSDANGMVSLCPECRTRLTPKVYTCAACGLVFKDEATMRKRVLLIPGGGYFYTGHPVLGLVVAIGESYFTLLLLLVIAGVAVAGANESAEMISGVLGIAMLLGFEKLVALHHCRRMVEDYIPTAQRSAPHVLASSATAGKSF